MDWDIFEAWERTARSSNVGRFHLFLSRVPGGCGPPPRPTPPPAVHPRRPPPRPAPLAAPTPSKAANDTATHTQPRSAVLTSQVSVGSAPPPLRSAARLRAMCPSASLGVPRRPSKRIAQTFPLAASGVAPSRQPGWRPHRSPAEHAPRLRVAPLLAGPPL